MCPMGSLFLSFTIAIGGAVSLVTLSKFYDLEFYTSKLLPLIPILYAIVYEVIEHMKGGKGRTALPVPSQGQGTAKDTGAPPAIQGLALNRVLLGVGVSFLIKFMVEGSLVLLFLQYTSQTFHQVYGPFGLETIGTFLRGEHPWLSGNAGIYMLALIALITCFGTGLWIGYTTRGKAILEGVITGAAITVIASMTNMLALYQKFEQVTVKLADTMGYALHAGFVVVVGLQVLLYGLWSGLVQMGKEERALQKVNKKTGRRTPQ
jgi:hypothetical protein